MSKPIDHLSMSLQQLLHRLIPSDDLPRFTQFQRLEERNKKLAQRFDEGAVPPPAHEQRLLALRKFHLQRALDRKDWRLISWGINDSSSDFDCLLEDSFAYRRVHEHFSEEVRSGSLARNCWFGLANGYFGYENDRPQENPNWAQLAGLLEQGFHLLATQQRRERPWVMAIRPHLDLFGPQPGARLAKAMAAGNSTEWQALQKYLPIPETSWLWGRIVEAHLDYISSLDDGNFLSHIPATLQLGQARPAHANRILAALLTRYAKSCYRETTESSLQETALRHWGSPQIGQRRGMWEHYVSEDVRRMVLKWFAKEDLIHFFSLLQDESGVDQSRLDYWMRFVGQMTYTRVVLGLSAQQNRSPEYIEFKKKNNGRFSTLSGGTRDDNAFIMQIGQYYFVEFSKKGNACYYYDGRNIAESLSGVSLSMYGDLKSNKGSKISHMAGWQYKLDQILAKFNIFPDKDELPSRMTSPALDSKLVNVREKKVENVHFLDENPSELRVAFEKSVTDEKNFGNDALRSLFNFDPPKRLSAGAKVNPPVGSSFSYAVGQSKPTSKVSLSVDEKISLARELVMGGSRNFSLVECDMRGKGGAFWFETGGNYLDFNTASKIKKLGFKFNVGRGYWIK